MPASIKESPRISIPQYTVCTAQPKVPDSRGVLARFVDEARTESYGAALANPEHSQGFIESEEVKLPLELTTKALFSKKAVSAKLKEVDSRKNVHV